MENYTGVFIEAEHLKLPIGFRFHPTDEELITHYLLKKVADANFSAIAIGVIDMNRVEPWDLACVGKIGENEWYFFCMRDKKYPTGLRKNRATAKGYWKATGRDTKIFRGKCLVGMKKTLVFYKGRAPNGKKTNWICKEFRLEGKSSGQDDWVIAKIYEKGGGKNVVIPSYPPPPLVDSPPSFIGSTISTTSAAADPGSGDMDCSEMLNYSGAFPNGFSYGQSQPNYLYPGYNCVQEQGIYGNFLGDYVLDIKTEEETMLSVSEGTSLITTDVNTEISSVLSNLEKGLNNYNLDQEGPSKFGEMEGSDDEWNY